MRQPRFAGTHASVWRSQIASLAQPNLRRINTIKLPVENAHLHLDFDNATAAYNFSHGIGRGTLTGFLCATHLAGFRLFPSAPEAAQFRNRNRYPEAQFRTALESRFNLSHPKISVQSLHRVLSKRRRRVRGQLPDWTTFQLARFLYADWTGDRPPSDLDNPVWEFANTIAQPVVAQIGNWNALADNPIRALSLVSDRLYQIYSGFPDFANLPPSIPHHPTTATICLDPSAKLVPIDPDTPEIALYQTVSILAAHLRRENPKMTLDHPAFAETLGLALTTPNSSGMSWLFGVGLNYFRETSLTRIARDFRASDKHRERLAQVVDYALALPPDPLFATNHHRDYSSQHGVRLRGWVSNYVARLQHLHALCADLPPIADHSRLAHSHHADLFDNLDFNAADLVHLAQSIPTRVDRATRAIATLSGDGIPTPNDLAALDAVRRDLRLYHERTRHLDRRIGHILNPANKSPYEDHQLVTLASIRDQLNATLPAFPHLTRFTGGRIATETDTATLETNFNLALATRRTHFDRLHRWAIQHNRENGLPLRPHPALRSKEEDALIRQATDPALAVEYATRRILHALSYRLRRLTPETAHALRAPLRAALGSRREAQKLFQPPGTAVLYPPRSDRTNSPLLPINLDRAAGEDFVALVAQAMSELENRLAEHPDRTSAHLRDLLILEEFIFHIELQILFGPVPADVATPDYENLPLTIPSSLTHALAGETVTAGTALRAFSLLTNLVNALWYRVSRPGIRVPATFHRTQHNTLVYVPKDREWTPPTRYLEAKGAIANALSSDAIVRISNTAIAPLETLKQLSHSEYRTPGARELLVQLPHDWYVELNLRNDEPLPVTGTRITKTGTNLAKVADTTKPAYRLIGPPAYKNQLDQTLLGQHLRFGEWSLNITREYRYQLQYRNRTLSLAAVPERDYVEIALPLQLNTDIAPAPETLFYDRFAIIHLIRQHVHYAIFSIRDCLDIGTSNPILCKTGRPLVGHLSVSSARWRAAPAPRLPKPKRMRHRARTAPGEEFAVIRKTDIGAMCRTINQILSQHRAFPVLEPLAHTSGNTQFDLIHRAVLQHYLYSSTDSHRLMRRNFWFGAYRWTHPYLRLHSWDPDAHAFTGPPEPVALYPGMSFATAGAYHTCSRCRRNPFDSIDALNHSRNVHRGTPIDIGNGTIDPVVAPGKYTSRQLARAIRQYLRQRPNPKSPQTPRQEFRCLYTDCHHRVRQLPNAIINHGKALIERIDTRATHAALERLNAKKSEQVS